MNANVFLALQANDDTRPIVDAIAHDNPHAKVSHMPALIRIDAPGRLVVNRESVELNLGRAWDVQEIHLNLISISGNVNETEDHFAIGWRNATTAA